MKRAFALTLSRTPHSGAPNSDTEFLLTQSLNRLPLLLTLTIFALNFL